MTDQSTIRGASATAIAASAERAIRAGSFRPGDRLPPIRPLAARLGVSPATVAAAYARLRERGVAAGAGRAGTRVLDRPALAVRVSAPVVPGLIDVSDGNPDRRLLPRLRVRPEGPLLYGAEPNDARLLELAAEAFLADGLPAGELAVVGGALDGIERVLGAHVRPGDRVGVEDPGFTRVLDLLAALRLRAVPIAVDDRGLFPEALGAALATGVEALVATPRAQNPTGAALDAARAAELEAVLDARPDVLVVEDDHAGPVAGAPVRTLTHRRRRWAVLRSFAKALGPDLRVAVLLGDDETVARVQGRQVLGPGWVSHILQGIVRDELERPATQRLLRRAASTYAARRERLVSALGEHDVPARGRSGLNVWVPVAEESAAVQALAARGYAVAAGERFRLASPPAVRITVAALDAEAIDACADALAAALRPRKARYNA